MFSKKEYNFLKKIKKFKTLKGEKNKRAKTTGKKFDYLQDLARNTGSRFGINNDSKEIKNIELNI